MPTTKRDGEGVVWCLNCCFVEKGEEGVCVISFLRLVVLLVVDTVLFDCIGRLESGGVSLSLNCWTG